MDPHAVTPAAEASPIFDDIWEEQRLGLQQQIRKCRNTLFLAGGLMVLGDLIFIAVNNSEEYNVPLILGMDAVILAVFTGLGLLTRRKPHTAIVSGLVFFLIMQVLIITNAVLEDPEQLFATLRSGIILKIYLVVTLVKGLRPSRELQAMLEEERAV